MSINMNQQNLVIASIGCISQLKYKCHRVVRVFRKFIISYIKNNNNY